MQPPSRLKLLRSLDVTRKELPVLPPFGISVLTAHLREHGVQVDQDDLNVRCFSPHRDRPAVDRERLLARCRDRDAVLAFLDGRADPELEALAASVLGTTELRGYDAVLFSVFPTDEASSLLTLMLARQVKRATGALVVVGGEYNQFGLVGELFDRLPPGAVVDYYVQGPGEAPLVLLLEALAGRGQLADVPGLVYREAGAVRRNDYVPNLRTLQLPTFDGLPLSLYAWRPDPTLLSLAGAGPGATPEGVLTLPFQLSTVCPNRCAFCSQSGLFPPRGSLLDPQEAAARLVELSRRYQTRCFFLLDDSLNVSRPFLETFCEELLSRGADLLWSDCIRANNLDRDLVRLMRRAGAVRLIIGLETASPRLLEYIGKGVSREQVGQVLGWAHEAGIHTGVEVIAGLPTETTADVEHSLGFLRQHRHVIDEAYLNPFYLERNSLMFKHPERYGIENIRTDRGLLASRGKILGHLNATYMFDEVGGARWEAKSEQILASFLRMHGALNELRLWPAGDFGLSALFWLHLRGGSDAAIRSTYAAYVAAAQRRKTFGLETFRKGLAELRSGTSLRERAATLRRAWDRVRGALAR